MTCSLYTQTNIFFHSFSKLWIISVMHPINKFHNLDWFIIIYIFYKTIAIWTAFKKICPNSSDGWNKSRLPRQCASNIYSSIGTRSYQYHTDLCPSIISGICSDCNNSLSYKRHFHGNNKVKWLKEDKKHNISSRKYIIDTKVK